MEKNITLEKGVKIAGAMVFELTMIQPTMGHEEDAMSMAVSMKKLEVPLTTEMCLFAVLCRIPYEAIRTMTSGDYSKLRECYHSFLLQSPKVFGLGTQAENLPLSGED